MMAKSTPQSLETVLGMADRVITQCTTEMASAPAWKRATQWYRDRVQQRNRMVANRAAVVAELEALLATAK